MPMATMVTLQEANQFFLDRLYTESWDAANDTTKQKALGHAETQIKALVFNSSQTIPGGKLKDAICVQALYLLDRTSSDRERHRAQRSGVKFRWVGNAREDYAGRVQEISPDALEFLKGFVQRKMGGIR